MLLRVLRARVVPDVNIPYPPPTALSALQLDRALQLLGHSGQPLPSAEPGSPAWLQGVIDALVDLSSRDALTGLANRRAFDLVLAREIDRVARSGEPALLLALDIDHFKRVNDSWGHETGDRVLRETGSTLLQMLRATDIATRMGGEEFVVLLPATALAAAVDCAERFRTALAARDFGLPTPVTSSFGVAALLPAEAGNALLARADGALYLAKQQGRNRVMAAIPAGPAAAEPLKRAHATS